MHTSLGEVVWGKDVSITEAKVNASSNQLRGNNFSSTFYLVVLLRIMMSAEEEEKAKDKKKRIKKKGGKKTSMKDYQKRTQCVGEGGGSVGHKTKKIGGQ